MSQAKVDKRKQEKYNRKNAPKQSRLKKYLSYGCATLVAAALVVYLGYSVAIETGLYKPEETTTAYVSSVTAEELASTLSTSGDALGFYTKALEEAASSEEATDANSEEATDANSEEATKKDSKKKSDESTKKDSENSDEE